MPISTSARRRGVALLSGVLGTGLLLAGFSLVSTESARAAATSEGTITFIKAGNVFVAQTDGSSERQVTFDGTPTNPYYSPTESDNGQIVAGRADLIYRMDQWGHVFNTINPPDLRSAGGGTIGGQMSSIAASPDGTKIAYTYNQRYCSGDNRCRYWPVTGFTSATSLSDPAVYGTTNGATPAWVNNVRVVLDSIDPFGNIYLYDLGRGPVFSAGWFDGYRLFDDSRTNIADVEISLGTTYAVGIENGLDHERVTFIELDGLGDLDSGVPDVPVDKWMCQASEVSGVDSPTWSADGQVAAWEEPSGVWSVAMGGAPCKSTPELVVPGGTDPSFSRASLQTSRPTYPTPTDPTQPVPTGPADPTTGPALPTATPTKPAETTSSFIVKSEPKVKGKAKVGRKLRASSGSLVPAPTKVRYQWLRDRKAIKGATKATYKVTRKDRRHRLAVRVTGTREGFHDVVTTTKPVRVRR